MLSKTKTPRWFHLSFIDGNGFLGAAIVRARCKTAKARC